MKINLLTVAASGIFLIAAALLAYYFYLLYWPFQFIKFDPAEIPILNPNKVVRNGEVIETKFSFCVYNQVPITTQRVFREQGGDQRSYFLNEMSTVPKEKGCRTVTSATYKAPTDIHPGKYRIELKLIYKVNFLRTEVQNIQTEEFEIRHE